MRERMDAGELELFRKDVKHFFLKFFLYTEGIAFFFIIPLSALIFFMALKIEDELITIAFLFIMGGIAAALVISYFTSRFLLAPLTRYFDALLEGREITEEEFTRACRRYYSLPKLHSAFVVARWMFIMSCIIVLIHMVSLPSLTDNVNMGAVFVVDTILGGLLFYIVPERLLNVIAIHGIFAVRQDEVSEDQKTKRSLSRNISFVVIAIIVNVAVVMIAIAHNRIDGIYKKTMLEQISNSATILTGETEAFLEGVMNTGKGIAENRYFLDFIRAGNSAKAGEILRNTARISGWCEYIIYAGTEGTGPIIASSFEKMPDKADFKGLYENSVIEARLGKTSITHAHKSPYTGSPVIMLSYPVMVNGASTGVIGLAINLQSMSHEIFTEERSMAGTETFIIDNSLKIMAHNSPEKILTGLSAEPWTRKIQGLTERNEFKTIRDGSHYYTANRKGKKYEFILSLGIYESELEKNSWSITLFMIISFMGGLIFVGYLVYFMIDKKLAPLNKTKRAINRMADGNLQQVLYNNTGDEVGEILDSVMRLTSRLNDAIRKIKDISINLSSYTEVMSRVNGVFSQNAQNQAATTEEVTATVEQVSAGIDHINANTESQNMALGSLISAIQDLSKTVEKMDAMIRESRDTVQNITRKAMEGNDSLKTINSTMLKITDSSNQMMDIVGIINDISDQVNLLSLNAAIEAARAGEYGRGFAVVSGEISKLAEQTSSSIGSINRLIKTNDGEIKKGMTSIMSAIDVISSIIESINSIGSMTSGISDQVGAQMRINRGVNEKTEQVRRESEEIQSATSEQKRAVSEIVKSITHINELTQTNAAGTEEVTANSRNIIQMSEALMKAVDYFSIKK